MTKLSTVPYAYEPGLTDRLLGAVLEAAHAYGGKVIVYMKNRVSFPLTYRGIEPQDKKGKSRWRCGLRFWRFCAARFALCPFIT